MEALSSDSGARTSFAERLALLYKEAGNPPLKRVAEAVVRLQRVDERGRPVRVSAQRISDWRRAKNVPAQFAALAAVLHVLIPEARRERPAPVSPGLYDMAQWHRLWERAVADPVGERAGAAAGPDGNPDSGEPSGSGDGGGSGAGGVASVCPYRGLASYRSQDAQWFFGRERSTDALLAQLRAAESGGLVMLVGASGAGKSSLLNAGLVPALQGGASLAQEEGSAWVAGPVLQLVPGADPLTELTRNIPELARVLPAGEGEQEQGEDEPAVDDRARACAQSVREAIAAWGEREGGAAAGERAPRTTAGERATRTAAGEQEGGAASGAREGGAASGARDIGAAASGRADGAAEVDGAGRSGAVAVSRPVIIVDQFEETFTLCPDEADRRAFIRVLHAACSPGEGETHAPALVVLGIRADFYEECLGYPELADALQHRHMVLGPLTTSELRKAVTGPAKAVGLELEPGLAELIVREVSTDGPRGAHDAGVLPLLSHALLATWQRRKTGRLTLAGYRAAGGIQGAVAATAERAWSGLDPAARTAARLLLLRLVRLGEDTQATRRRGTRRQLAEESTDPHKTEESLEALVRARLVTLDAETVEITHEALLHAWPRLRDWIDEDRNDHLLRQRLEEDGKSWEDSDRDSSLLYRGSRLEQAREWARTAGDTYLTKGAMEFLAASARLRRRMVWISRGAVATLVVLAMVAVVSAVVARQQRDDAVFEQVVAEADRAQHTDPSLSAQLDLVAHRLRPGDEGTRNRLISIVNAPLATPLLGHKGAVYLTSFSPNGQLLATASYDRTVRLWDLSDPTHPEPLGKPLTGHKSWVSTAVFSPDGNTLASASDDGTIRLWNVRDPRHPRLLGSPVTGQGGAIYLLAFSPDGKTLAAANEDKAVRLWDVDEPREPKRIAKLTGHTEAVRSVAFSHDGRTLAAGGDDGTIHLWNTDDPNRPQPVDTVLRGHSTTVHSVAFSPDDDTLASGGADNTIRLWDVSDPEHGKALGTPLTGHTGPLWSVAFNPAGTMLAAASADSTASLWNVRDPSHPSQVGESLSGSSGEMYALGFSPDGRFLATGSGDNKVRLWSISTGDMLGRIGAFRPDGKVLATASRDEKVRLWDVQQPERPTPLGKPFRPGEGNVRAPVFSPDGRTLAVLTGNRAVQLWNVADPKHPVPYGPPVRLRTRFAAALAFSRDGRTLATPYTDRTIQLWDITSPTRPRRLGEPLTGHQGYVNSLTFGKDGRTLVSGSADGTVRLWNVTDARRAVPFQPPLKGHLGPVNTVVYSPDGRTLASGSDDGTVRLWDIGDPREPARLDASLAGHTDAVVALTFSKDGHTLATGGNDNTVRLWNVADPTDTSPIGQSMSPNTKMGSFLSFSPQSDMLGVASGTDTVRLWNLDTEEAVKRICSTTRGVLTREKWDEYLPRLSYEPPCDE
ncbi:hypothetical protein [Streptomyces venezuelae]|uniref:nSTAND1 domain-containing NTPase n=1 Tax=Streptomyces venezuelae TaxID=54571 RepID=UPI0037AFC7DC